MTQMILQPRNGRAPKDYALMYAGMGWKVFPVWNAVDGRCACDKGEDCERPAKHPVADLVPSGASDATSERSKIESWWGNRPAMNIGIATGAVSGITVVDADAGEGKPGLINYTRICAEHGGSPQTMTSVTGGGGLHVIFKYNANLRTGTDVLAEAIDVRNDGGYIIVPPSTHMRGSYRWREEVAELKELPDWMINAPAEAAHRQARRRGRPRMHAAMPLPRLESMLARVGSDDRDKWLKVGLLLGRLYVGSPAEGEAWALYEAWAARSSSFDEDRAGNIARMREQFYDYSQQPPRPGAEPLGVGTLIMWAREGGWTPFGDREAVPYEPGNESEMCDALVRALVADQESNRFFNVSGEVRDVHLSTIPSVRLMTLANAEGRETPKALQVRKTLTPELQSALSEKAVLSTTTKEGVPVAKPIPEGLVSMILRDKSHEFPTLSGIAEWPMVMGGRILYKRRGYDAETGLYFDIDQSVKIDDTLHPTAGWEWMRDELLRDFPFENEIHQAGALALALCFLQRPLMKTCPAFAAVAPQPGTGKSTLIEMMALGIHGQAIAPHAFSNDDEELRKALHALMLAKIPSVMFDNVGRGKAVSSDHLAKLITAEISADRTLGSSEMRKEINTLLITFTGNNIVFVRDLASRVVTIQLNAKTGNPLGRRFAHPDIRAWALRNRNKLLSSLVAIAQLADGERPEDGVPSRFEDYDTMIVKPVLAVTGIDVRELNVVADIDAEEDAETKDVLMNLYKWQQSWRDAENGKGWRAADVINAMAGNAFPATVADAIRRFAGPLRNWENDPTRTLGYALRAVRNDYKFAPFVLTSETRKDAARWLIKGPPVEEMAETPGTSTPAF